MKIFKFCLGIFVPLAVTAFILIYPAYELDSARYSFLIVGGVFLLALGYKYFSKRNNFTLQDMCEIGVYIAIALVLDAFVKIRIGANGGSISVVMVPLLLLALRKGFVKGFLACGIVFALINCLSDGYGFITFPLDYMLGFGSMAILGLFRKIILNKENRLTIKGTIFLILGVVLSIFVRFVASTISGIVLYGVNLVDSMVYQILYLGPSAVAVLAILLILYKPLLVIEKRHPSF